MSVVRPRNRLVYFRITEQEFQALTDLCQDGKEARSISELVRSAVQRTIAENGNHAAPNIAEQISALTVTIENFLAQVQVSMKALAQLQAHGNGERPNEENNHGSPISS